MSFKRTKVCVGVLAALGSALAPAVWAQTAERVEVTGSRIKTFEVESPSPIVSLTADQIKVEGVRNVEQLLNNMPQVFADQGAQVSNGSSGTATVNLRNLGSTRNLVLVNGRRLPAGSVRDPSADLNSIPLALIKRVDLLTGGASAVYGSDAVSGVVNFIMNDKFEGLQLDVNHQFYQHSQGSDIAELVKARGFPVPGNKSHDGASNDFAVTLGSNFANGKGNAVVFFSYKKEQALLQSERDFTSCALNAGPTNFVCGGSGTSYPGQFTDFATYALTVADKDGNTRDYNGATDAYNFGPLNYFRRPSDRYNFAALAHYDISEKARVYSELYFHDDSTVAQIAPSGIFFQAFDIKAANPLLSADWKTKLGLDTATSTQVYIGRRNVEGGGRQDDRRHSSFRSVVGVKGDSGPWSYDVSAQVGKVLYQQTYLNDFSITRIGRALDVVKDPTTGNPVCASALDGTDPNCVPYNIWKLGGVTPDALKYLQTPLFARGSTSQMVFGANVSADLGEFGLKLPTSKNGVQITVGAESRLERIDLKTDTAFTTGDGAGQGGPSIGLGGSYRVKEVFGELNVPIMERQPGAYLLNLKGDYRHSSYSTGQSTNTFGLGMEYAPIKEVKLRGSYQKAVRAANVVELFQAQELGLYDRTDDPCSGAIDPATGIVAGGATLTECARTGVTAAQYGSIPASPAGQYNQISGGNPDLKPETAKSFTWGVVFSPVKDMNVSFDYFNIKVEDQVGTVSPLTTMEECLKTGNASLCSLINRDAKGSLWLTGNIVATNANLGMQQTKGFDLGFDYTMKLAAMGSLDFTLVGTRLKSFVTQELPTSTPYDCAGLWGDTCGTPLPKWRHKLRTQWNTPWDLSLAATWRHIDDVEIDTGTGHAGLPTTPVAEYRRILGKQNYLDLQASYNITKNVTARLIVNNLLDKDPPIRTQGAGFVNGNTYPVVYDALGRQVTLSLTATF